MYSGKTKWLTMQLEICGLITIDISNIRKFIPRQILDLQRYFLCLCWNQFPNQRHSLLQRSRFQIRSWPMTFVSAAALFVLSDAAARCTFSPILPKTSPAVHQKHPRPKNAVLPQKMNYKVPSHQTNTSKC